MEATMVRGSSDQGESRDSMRIVKMARPVYGMTHSSYGYPKEYENSKDIASQVARIYELFPELRPKEGGDWSERMDQSLLHDIQTNKAALYSGAEGWDAIPHWSMLSDNPNDALQILADRLGGVYNTGFENFCGKKLGISRHLQETPEKKNAIEILRNQQKGADILLIQTQSGILHRGESAEYACYVVQEKNEAFRSNSTLSSNSETDCEEFLLGLYENIWKIFIRPERFLGPDDLWLSCAGDRYSPDTNGRFSYEPILRFNDAKVKLNVRSFQNVSPHYGASSGFFRRVAHTF